jgi:hypothetical protein
MGGRERGRQSAGYTEAQSKADREAAGIQQQVNRQQSGKIGRQSGRWLACGSQAACKQTYRSTRSRTASMKQ